MSFLLFHSQEPLPNLYYQCRDPKCPQRIKLKMCVQPCAHTHTSLFALNGKFSVLYLTSCSERRDLEANVEVRGQNEVFQEKIHVPLPRLPHHLPALPKPLHG